MKIEIEKQWVERLLDLARETVNTTREDENLINSVESVPVLSAIERLGGYIESAGSFLKEEKENER